MKKARAAEARLQNLTKTYGIDPKSVRAVQVACVQAVSLYGIELWWDQREVGRRDDLKLLLYRQPSSILGALPTTPQGALMRESVLTPVQVIVDSREQRFAARLENSRSSKLKELHKNHASGAPICRAVRNEEEHGRTTEGMNWPALGKDPVVRNPILDDTTAAKNAAQHWARAKEAPIGAGVWMWWTDESQSDNGQVAAAAVCKHRNEWRSCCSCLCTGHMEVFNAEQWVIRSALLVAIEERETLQKQGVQTVAVFSDSRAEFRHAAHLAPGPSTATGNADQQKSAKSPCPRHHNQDPLGPGTFQHPRK
jgi:hypothetical protein